MSLKINRKWDQKWVPAGVTFEIAGLRHFLPSKHFLWFFVVYFCMAFWRFLGVSWAALGFLVFLLWGLWSQKRVKNWCILRVLKRLFCAYDGSFGLDLVCLVNCFWTLCKSAGPNCVSKLHCYPSYFGSRAILKINNKKKWIILASFFEQIWVFFWVSFWDQIGQRGGQLSPWQPFGDQRAKMLHFENP